MSTKPLRRLVYRYITTLDSYKARRFDRMIDVRVKGHAYMCDPHSLQR